MKAESMCKGSRESIMSVRFTKGLIEREAACTHRSKLNSALEVHQHFPPLSDRRERERLPHDLCPFLHLFVLCGSIADLINAKLNSLLVIGIRVVRGEHL